MRLAHIVAIMAFALALLFSGGNLANGVQTGAAWGFWVSLILGSITTLIMLVFMMIGMMGGGLAGHQEAGVLGALLGSLGFGALIAISIFSAIASVVLAVFGYDALKAWGASNFEDKNALIKACVLIGLSIILSFLKTKKRKQISFSSGRR